jgi:hydrogenase expression/formation protein HypE
MEKKILLAHGSGGTLMHDLIKGLLLKQLNNPVLKELADSACLNYREQLAFTTDSFVVSPLFFPGGDIGKLSVCGTINDLVMSGARPEYLSLALIIEEGLDYGILEKIVHSIAVTAKKSGVHIATGDLKVVEIGACDKIFINTSGIGRIIAKKKISLKSILPGDKIIITGEIGQHGFSVLTKRKEFSLGFNITSDCAALDKLILPVVQKTSGIKFMRDPTRGGLATTLNEIAQGSGLGIMINEKSISVSAKVRAAGELLGVDTLYVACEGRAIIIVDKSMAKKALALLKKHPLGRQAQIIGEVTKVPKGRVVLKTILGTERLIDMLTSEPLPRIC